MYTQNEIREQRQREQDERRLSSIWNNAYFSFVVTEALNPSQDQRARSCSSALPSTVPKSWSEECASPMLQLTKHLSKVWEVHFWAVCGRDSSGRFLIVIVGVAKLFWHSIDNNTW